MLCCGGCLWNYWLWCFWMNFRHMFDLNYLIVWTLPMCVINLCRMLNLNYQTNIWDVCEKGLKICGKQNWGVKSIYKELSISRCFSPLNYKGSATQMPLEPPRPPRFLGRRNESRLSSQLGVETPNAPAPKKSALRFVNSIERSQGITRRSCGRYLATSMLNVPPSQWDVLRLPPCHAHAFHYGRTCTH